MRVVALLLFFLSFAAVAHAQSQGEQGMPPSSAFDGNWIGTVSCEDAHGALGYHWSFLATVQQGRFHGIHGTLGQPDSFELTGTINPDGTAHFFGKGLTGGNPNTNVGRVGAGAVYSYHANGMFTANHGHARRVELRPCTLDFHKQ